uniref:Uncharacterized protein n=1 Tax=Anopheles atroparvus TaxID=41427 RepID=A0A182JEM4_ANOAO
MLSKTNNGQVDDRSRLQWDREQFDIRRPYERKEYERPHRALPNYLAAFEGLNVKPQKCSVPNAFTRRTPIEEVFHERNRTIVCPKEAPRTLEDCVGDVIIADNVSSSASDSEPEQMEEQENDAHERQVLKECRKTFLRARRTLLRSELFDRYFNRAPSPANDNESSESEETLEEFEQIAGEEQKLEQHDLVGALEQLNENAGTIIVHKESKPAVVESQQQFLDRLRTRYLERFDRVRQGMEEEEQERTKHPEPFDGERYMAEYPAPDIRNEAKAHFRESLRARLEELNKLQQRPVRQYPRTAKQFAEYKERIMEDRRKLRDEAEIVEDHFRKAGTPREIPEAKLEVKRFRLADFGDAPEDSDAEGEQQAVRPLVYHTCMTREEWGHWIARSTKTEKLKLPKVSVARVPVVVQKCHESPIRAYIQGRPSTTAAENEAKKQEHRRPKKIIHSIPTACPPCQTMRDLLFDPAPKPEPMEFVPFNASLRPYSDIVEERLRIGKEQRKAQRQLRKSRMRWIEELVDEICRRRRD